MQRRAGFEVRSECGESLERRPGEGSTGAIKRGAQGRSQWRRQTQKSKEFDWRSCGRSSTDLAERRRRGLLCRATAGSRRSEEEVSLVQYRRLIRQSLK